MVTRDYYGFMQVVNIKELKARLSAYLREVGRGETFLVTDQSRVVARLGPADVAMTDAAPDGSALGRLVALGARPPLRERRPADYRRSGPTARFSEKRINGLMEWLRGEGEGVE